MLLAATRIPLASDARRPTARGPPPSSRLSWWWPARRWPPWRSPGWRPPGRRRRTPRSRSTRSRFHLPNIARWIQTGTLLADRRARRRSSPRGTTPTTGTSCSCRRCSPGSNDAFARPLAPLLAAVAGLSVYVIAAELRAPRATAVLLAALFACLPVLISASPPAPRPTRRCWPASGRGLAFLLRHFRTGMTSDLVLAGLGLGLAFGTKWYAVTGVLVVVVCWVAAWLLARRPLATLLRPGLLFTGLVAAAGGFWMVRNLVESGNPVFPVQMAAFGLRALLRAARRAARVLGFLDLRLHHRPGHLAGALPSRLSLPSRAARPAAGPGRVGRSGGRGATAAAAPGPVPALGADAVLPAGHRGPPLRGVHAHAVHGLRRARGAEWHRLERALARTRVPHLRRADRLGRGPPGTRQARGGGPCAAARAPRRPEVLRRPPAARARRRRGAFASPARRSFTPRAGGRPGWRWRSGWERSWRSRCSATSAKWSSTTAVMRAATP